MKLSLLSILPACLILCSSALQGQSVTFVVEKDAIKLADGTPISRDADPDNRSGIAVFGAYFSPAELATFSSSITDFVSLSATNPVQALEDLKTSLGSKSWTGIETASGAFAGIRDWSWNIGTGTVGHTPVMVVLTTSNPASLTLQDQVGIVASNFTLTGLAATVVGFNTTNKWDIALAGNLNSLTLAPIPEPSTYALLFGIGALGVILMRRRRK